MRILIPLDGSDVAQAAVAVARTLTRNAAGTVILFHATWPGMPGEQADKRLESELEALRASGVEATLERRPTPRDEETGLVIASAADELNADLIVMTTHGRGGLGRWLFGSVAEQVMGSAKMPVLLIPSGLALNWPVDHRAAVLVALDGTDKAKRPLEPAVDMARALDAEIILARILPTGEESNPVDSESTELTHEYLASVGADLEAVGLSTRQLVRHGEPAKAIGALAQELNVAALAIGGPDRGDSGSKTLGQIALGIIRRSDVPVLIA